MKLLLPAPPLEVAVPAARKEMKGANEMTGEGAAAGTTKGIEEARAITATTGAEVR